MKIPTEPIGSIPRPQELISAISGMHDGADMEQLVTNAVRSTLDEFTKTGSPVVTDGEQGKTSFVTYPLSGSPDLKEGGMRIDFADGHFRQLPLLTKGPFRYQNYAVQYLKKAQELTTLPVKQAVISASALSLIYPPDGIAGYSRESFIDDLISECEKDIRQCLDNGAWKVQMDFTEGRLSLKLDPSGGVLNHFVDLNNQVLGRFSKEEQKRIGVHVCPGGDHDSTHSADIDYAMLIPPLFKLHAGNFYLQLASEKDPKHVLEVIRKNIRPDQKVFIGVIDVNSTVVETSDQVCERVLEAATYIPAEQLGTTDDCGFSPFCDDTSTTRETAFAKIKSRIAGTKMAEEILQKQFERVRA